MRRVTAREANQRFSEVLSAVETGEQVVITKRGRPVVLMSPYPAEALAAERQAAISNDRFDERAGDLARRLSNVHPRRNARVLMSCTFDTNILVYTLGQPADVKRQRAQSLITRGDRRQTAVLLRRSPTWHATNQRVAPPTVVEVTLPHLALAAINLTGIVVGLSSIENPTGTAICVALCTLHLAILGTVIAHAAIDRHHLIRTGEVIDLRDPVQIREVVSA